MSLQRSAMNMVVGTAAELAAADETLGFGAIARARDTGEMVVGPGSWASLSTFEPRGGRLLDSASSAAQQNITNTATIITGINIQFEVTTRPVIVELDAPWFTAGTGTTALTVGFGLTSAPVGTTIKVAGSSTTDGQIRPFLVRHVFTTPGEYDLSARAGRFGAGTAVVNSGGANTIVLMTAIEL